MQPETSRSRRYLVEICIAGFIADGITTWFGYGHHTREFNPVNAGMFHTFGLTFTLLFITTVRIAVVLAVIPLEDYFRSKTQPDRWYFVHNAALIALCLFAFIGWGLAAHNLTIMF